MAPSARQPPWSRRGLFFSIVIGEDHSTLRAVIRRTLCLHDQCDVVGEASGNDELNACCRQGLPDVLLLDARLSGTPTRKVILALRRSIPRMRIVILSAEDAPCFKRVIRPP
jgi:DNA-binding NarL/FixJ family response regulator